MEPQMAPPQGQEQQGGGGDPIAEALDGMNASLQADAQAADMIEQMGNKQAADLLRKSAELKGQALQALTQDSSQATSGMQDPNTAGSKGAVPVGMNTRG